MGTSVVPVVNAVGSSLRCYGQFYTPHLRSTRCERPPSTSTLSNALSHESPIPPMYAIKTDLVAYRIKSACRKGKTSVPRSRVYAAYVKRCAHEKIAVLNPASFGKLVRVLYPGLRTRRLGVRGESKYHYVEFELELDMVDEDYVESPRQLPVAGPSAPSFTESLNLK